MAAGNEETKICLKKQENEKVREREQPFTKDKVQGANVNSDEPEVAGRKVTIRKNWKLCRKDTLCQLAVMMGCLQ
jgi:hypothetical protein